MLTQILLILLNIKYRVENSILNVFCSVKPLFGCYLR